MITLTETTDTIEVDLASAHTSTSLKCVATWRDLTSSAMTPGRSLQTTNGTTEVTLVAAPAASTDRLVDFISVFNEDTITHTVTVRFDANATQYTLFEAELQSGETLQYTDADGWRTFADGGALKQSMVSGFNPVSNGWTTVILGADVTNNNAVANTIADVTGFSFAVTSGQRYWFQAFIYFTAAATTTGARWSVNGPATTQLAFISQMPTSTSAIFDNQGLSAYDTPASSTSASASTASNIAILRGFILPSANGTLIVRFASEVSSSAIVAKQGSILQYMAV